MPMYCYIFQRKDDAIHLFILCDYHKAFPIVDIQLWGLLWSSE